jgi:uncharacterized membrane protein YoaK (UPF0700 family)
MTRLESRARLFACLLSALAGFVDAIGFIQTGGFFVSFMSGNSTRLGVGVAESARSAVVAAGIILCFLVGVVGGSLLGARFEARRPAAVLFAIAVLTGLAALLELYGAPGYAIALLAAAMGAENAVFERGGEVRIGVTYMTGSLVRVGNGIASAILGRGGNGWTGYLLLWLGFVAGAVAGALAFGSGNSETLWAASGVAVVLGLLSLWLFPATGADSRAARATG